MTERQTAGRKNRSEIGATCLDAQALPPRDPRALNVPIVGRALGGAVFVEQVGSRVWLDAEGARFVRDELGRLLLEDAKTVRISRKDIRP